MKIQNNCVSKTTPPSFHRIFLNYYSVAIKIPASVF